MVGRPRVYLTVLDSLGGLTPRGWPGVHARGLTGGQGNPPRAWDQ